MTPALQLFPLVLLDQKNGPGIFTALRFPERSVDNDFQVRYETLVGARGFFFVFFSTMSPRTVYKLHDLQPPGAPAWSSDVAPKMLLPINIHCMREGRCVFSRVTGNVIILIKKSHSGESCGSSSTLPWYIGTHQANQKEPRHSSNVRRRNVTKGM